MALDALHDLIHAVIEMHTFQTGNAGFDVVVLEFRVDGVKVFVEGHTDHIEAVERMEHVESETVVKRNEFRKVLRILAISKRGMYRKETTELTRNGMTQLGVGGNQGRHTAQLLRLSWPSTLPASNPSRRGRFRAFAPDLQNIVVD